MSEQQQSSVHHRNILSHLGIDLWIPRDVAVEENDASVFWRDQVSCAEINLNEEAELNVESISIEREVKLENIEPQSIISLEKLEKEIDPFILTVLVSVKKIIFINTFDISSEERTLLNNMIHTLELVQYELKWPILETLKDSNFLQFYLDGFIDAKCNEFECAVLLGNRPKGLVFTFNKEFPSLSQLLNSAQDKRDLWEYWKSV